MSSFTLKFMAGSLPQANGSNAKRSAVASVKQPMLPPQMCSVKFDYLKVRAKELQKLETPEKTQMNVTRRDLALFLTATSFGAATLSLPEPAEARISRTEMKNKILEKLKMLREKVGLSKPETEQNEKIDPPAPSRKQAEEVPVPPVPSLPKIHSDLKKTVVEAATLP